jgi:hypothetical protein
VAHEEQEFKQLLERQQVIQAMKKEEPVIIQSMATQDRVLD